MDFIRLYMSNTAEFYQVIEDDKDICYLMIHDMERPSKLRDFEGRILEEDFESRDNFISIKCLYLYADFEEKHLDEVAHYVDCLLSIKPSCDYYISLDQIKEEIDYHLPDGMNGILNFINTYYNIRLNSTNVDFNKLLQL
ncbi:hypothetical protein FZX01_15175 [Listeria monocytogenes]|uniref:hypothetical protein n=1 Tax=Listeria monocytogenes TaxID=1639 RepID=UPI0011EB96FB|nr:hypothetical protein [Listeria monocytogenes]TYU82822.1 hypothetical protein FZX01_15175 [Listeria monocytogenes]